MQSYFIWNGVDCRTMGVYLRGTVSRIKPEERVEHVTIPGRAGDLTLLEGDGIYNSYIQTAEIRVKSAAQIEPAINWLRGDGLVTFSGEPDKCQRARVIGAVTLDKLSRNLDIWVGNVQFYCEPLKRLVDAQDITVTINGTTITNPGDLYAMPSIIINGGAGIVTLRVGDRVLAISDAVDGMVVDCLNEWILVNGVPQGNAYSGSFPVLPVGNSMIQWTGTVSSLSITPNWRYI